MRLSEAAGLAREDIHLDKQLPYLEIKPHEWRRLKTNSSQRRLPLVGHSLWAVRQAYIASNGPFMFPKYCNENGCKSNSAIAQSILSPPVNLEGLESAGLIAI